MSAPLTDEAPLVGVETMANHDGVFGIMISTYRDSVPSGCPTTIKTNDGESCFYGDTQAPNSWVQVLVLGRENLSLVKSTDLQCDIATTIRQEKAFDTGGNPCTLALSNLVATYPGDLIIAANQQSTKGGDHQQVPVGVGAVLGGVGTNHGVGAPATWYNSPDHGAHLPDATRGTVSVVGVSGWKSGGISKESDHPDKAGTGNLHANLAMNNLGLYSPMTEADQLEGADSPITKVLEEHPTPWPTFTPGEAAAFSALSVHVKLGSDPRSQYYTKADAPAYWLALKSDIQATTYDSMKQPSFTKNEFLAAQKQLVEEVSDVYLVKQYTQDVAAPFAGASSTLWADFSYVSNAVNTDTSNGNSAEVLGLISTLVEGGLEIIPAFGGSAHMAGALVLASYR
ncbi:MAG: hypothetical protein WAM30_06565, partial [Candidatus Dormiibacterota bacterium]